MRIETWNKEKKQMKLISNKFELKFILNYSVYIHTRLSFGLPLEVFLFFYQSFSFSTIHICNSVDCKSLHFPLHKFEELLPSSPGMDLIIKNDFLFLLLTL